MVGVDFSAYLRFVCTAPRYEETLSRYTATDAIHLVLEAQTVVREEAGGREGEEPRQQVERFPVLEGLRKYAANHVLLSGKTEPQMREFVGKYLPEYGEVLLEQLQDRLREVAETPLLLKMLCEVFDPQTQQIPKSKGELFRAFDRKYNQHKPNPPVSGDFQRFQSEVLQHLAFEMVRGDREKPTESWLTITRSKAEGILEAWLDKRGVADAATKAKEWLEDLLEHHLLQVAADARQIEFHHQLFQEYYAAEALLVMVENRHPDVMDDERLQHFYLNYLKWTEPVALMLGLLGDEAQAVRVVRLALAVDLKLGARLAGEVKREFQKQTVKLLESAKVPTRWKFWFITLKHRVRIPKWLRVELLGNTRSSVAVPKLLTALEDEDSDVRRDVAKALGEIGSPEAIPRLLQALEDENCWMRGSAAEALGKIGSPQAIPRLLQALGDEYSDVRDQVAEALGEIGSEQAIPRLLQALRNEYFWGRRKVAEALGEIGSEQAIPRLLTALKDTNSHVRRSAADALGQIEQDNAPQILPDLLALIPKSREEVLLAISNIQQNCQFYNYKVFRKQLPLVVSPQPSGATVTNNINSEIVQIIEKNHGTVIGEQNLKAE